ncbi:LADA_0D08834g1_1 [Lachancea dasiensis]|uniref:LADA_0D08834g1_1 n=1 Tax=Lachancea dasiensis TaxID=1072105 RepID=A0A1G4J707_9SACH|nr:LADA_0D08834g1_1 [Lachancea dasiensis]
MSHNYHISTGRGGAGNVVSTSEKPSPKIVPQGSQTPSLLQPVFSTGRGGAGNMYKNVDRNLTRKAQDVDDHISGGEDHIEPVSSGGEKVHSVTSQTSALNTKQHNGKHTLKPSRSRHDSPQTVSIGRGGAGNMLSASSSRTSEGDKNRISAKNRSPKKGMWANIKNMFSQRDN